MWFRKLLLTSSLLQVAISNWDLAVSCFSPSSQQNRAACLSQQFPNVSDNGPLPFFCNCLDPYAPLTDIYTKFLARPWISATSRRRYRQSFLSPLPTSSENTSHSPREQTGQVPVQFLPCLPAKRKNTETKQKTGLWLPPTPILTIGPLLS